MVLFPRSQKNPGRLGHQGEEAVINVAYFRINCTMGVQRRDKGSALFHIRIVSCVAPCQTAFAKSTIIISVCL